MPRHLVIAGAQRCATTYLYRLLDQHPDITMARPVRPEPKYFLHADFSGDANRYRRKIFPGASTPWLGEKSTSYIELPIAAERIARLLPDAFVLFILRDPVERALSNYRFSVMQGLESLDLARALDQEAMRSATPHPGVSVSPFAYQRRGCYAEQLQPWYAHLAREQIRLVTTESLVGRAPTVMRSIFEQMGLDPEVNLTEAGGRINASADSGVVDAAMRRRLQQFYQAPNAQLADLYGVDITAWQ